MNSNTATVIIVGLVFLYFLGTDWIKAKYSDKKEK